MKITKHITTLAAGGLMALGAFAMPAQAQVSSTQDVFEQVRRDAASQRSENQQRIARFQAEAQQQESRLAEAKRELAQLQGRANSIQGQFAGNDARIQELEAELTDLQGEYRDLFGAARLKASEFAALLSNSLITAEYSGRAERLRELSDNDGQPSLDELNYLFEAMLTEIEAQREVKTFNAAVANVNDGAQQEVTRVGPFVAFTTNGAEFLSYRAPSEDNPIALTLLPRQPIDGAVRGAARDVVSASAGEVVYAPIDPTRGSLLQSFERVPSLQERISYGKTIGYIILGLLAIGVIFGLFNIVRLLLIRAAVSGQTRRAEAKKGNPLGRIMMAYDESRTKDANTVELKMDEAILRESPKLEFGLSLLKLGAAIAPLLGLLGTVTGMISTFQAMMIYGTGDPQLMAGGISEALVTTMLGLVAAIPLLVLHAFCASIARGIQNTLEEQSAGIVARHVESIPVVVDGTRGVNTGIV